MIGAGTIINPIIKVVTTVAILGAVYLFFVKPALDTTENIAESTRNAFSSSTGFGNTDFDLEHARSSAESYVTSVQSSWPAAGRELKGCIRAAGRDARAMERCRKLGLTMAHTLLSDYNFSNSYADSLDSQGKAAEADRVRDCVDDAGFRVGPMQRCRDLADKLLFG